MNEGGRRRVDPPFYGVWCELPLARRGYELDEQYPKAPLAGVQG